MDDLLVLPVARLACEARGAREETESMGPGGALQGGWHDPGSVCAHMD